MFDVDLIGSTDGVRVTGWLPVWDICQRLELRVGTCVPYEVHGRHVVLAFPIKQRNTTRVYRQWSD